MGACAPSTRYSASVSTRWCAGLPSSVMPKPNPESGLGRNDQTAFPGKKKLAAAPSSRRPHLHSIAVRVGARWRALRRPPAQVKPLEPVCRVWRRALLLHHDDRRFVHDRRRARQSSLSRCIPARTWEPLRLGIQPQTQRCRRLRWLCSTINQGESLAVIHVLTPSNARPAHLVVLPGDADNQPENP